MSHELLQAKRLEANKRAYDDRVSREDAARRAKESEVAQLEALEMELIEKLKRTQAQQQRAFNDLEAALSGGK